MRFFTKNISSKIACIGVLMSVFLLSACGTYTNAGYDGIYSQNTPQINNSEGQYVSQPQQEAYQQNNNANYEDYFARQSNLIADARQQMSYDANDVFTNPDNYSSTQGDSLSAEQTGSAYTLNNASWGANPQNVNINYYTSPRAGLYYSPYYSYYNSYYDPYDFWYWRDFYNPWWGYSYYPFYSPWRYNGFWGWPSWGLGFGFGSFYGGYYHYPYYAYANPYYPYSPSYHYGRRGYRSYRTDGVRRSTNRRLTTNATSGNRRYNSRGTRSTTQQRRTTTGNNVSKRIRNPKHINATRRRTNNFRNNSRTQQIQRRATRSRRSYNTTQRRQQTHTKSTRSKSTTHKTYKRPTRTYRRTTTRKRTTTFHPTRTRSVNTSHRSGRSTRSRGR